MLYIYCNKGDCRKKGAICDFIDHMKTRRPFQEPTGDGYTKELTKSWMQGFWCALFQTKA